MADTAVRGVIPYVFGADAGAVADWCVQALGLTERQRLGFTERQRWADDDGVVRVGTPMWPGEARIRARLTSWS